MIGASYRSPPLLEALARTIPIIQRDIGALGPVGVTTEDLTELTNGAAEVGRLMRDSVLRKHDTPLQMAEVAETMARVRAWLVELRLLASVNLGLDTPALTRVFSPAPEIADTYVRDLLEELEDKVKAGRDLKPRLEDIGVTEKFLNIGSKLAHQLRNAIGKEDIDAANLHFNTRRLYNRKADLVVLLKRVTRAGRYVFRADPAHASLYHLIELEPPLTAVA
jgi:hypothetical protein